MPLQLIVTIKAEDKMNFSFRRKNRKDGCVRYRISVLLNINEGAEDNLFV